MLPISFDAPLDSIQLSNRRDIELIYSLYLSEEDVDDDKEDHRMCVIADEGRPEATEDDINRDADRKQETCRDDRDTTCCDTGVIHPYVALRVRKH